MATVKFSPTRPSLPIQVLFVTSLASNVTALQRFQLYGNATKRHMLPFPPHYLQSGQDSFFFPVYLRKMNIFSHILLGHCPVFVLPPAYSSALTHLLKLLGFSPSIDGSGSSHTSIKSGVI